MSTIVEEEKKDQKCPRCKCYAYPKDFINPTGRVLKTCQKCRDNSKKNSTKNKCEHGRRRSHCKDCDGTAICEHNRIRITCKDCGGSQVCEHGRRRSQCKDCGGVSICEHGRQRSNCKDCGGSQICEHNRRRSECKDCDGSQVCEHNRIRSQCKKCSDPIKVTIKQWIPRSRQADKKKDRYDANNFIDKCFLKGLVEDYPECYYCTIQLQYIEYQDDLATIERIDNTLGHIKSNCVIACRKCNLSCVGDSR